MRMMFVTVVSAILAATTAPAAANEALCNSDIDKSSAKLIKAYESARKACLSNGATHACFLSGPGIDKAVNRLVANVASPTGYCAAALDQGTPLSSLGPGPVCPNVDGCGASVGAIDDLTDLSDCLVCVLRGLATTVNARIASSASSSAPTKCIRSLYFATLRSMRTGRKEVSRCIAGSTQPFACDVDDAADGKFGRALSKIRRKIDRCSDDLGIPGQLEVDTMNALCRDGPFFDSADLETCYGNTARCATCQYANFLFGQGQDCTEFSGSACHASTPADQPVYVVNAGDETVTYFDGSPAPVNATVAASSYPTGAGPVAVYSSLAYGVVYVANSLDGTVTYLDAGSGAPWLGTLANSTFAVGNEPVDLAVSDHVLWVVNHGDDSVTALHATTGRPMLGSLAASTFAVGAGPSAIAVKASSKGHRAVVANTDDDTITVFDSRAVDYLTADMATSTTAVGDGPAAAASGTNNLVYILNRTDGTYTSYDTSATLPSLVDTSSNTFVVGPDPIDIEWGEEFLNLIRTYWVTRASPADTLLVGPTIYPPLSNHEFELPGTPTALAFNYYINKIHVVLAGSELLATFGPELADDAALTACTSSDLVVDATTDRAYSVCVNSLQVLDASEPAYAFGDWASSTLPLPAGATYTRADVDPTTGRLYLTGCESPSNGAALTTLDTTTMTAVGAPVGTGPGPVIGLCGTGYDVAVDPVAGTVLVLNPTDGAVRYVDAATGDYLGGSEAAATLPVGSTPSRIAVRPDLGIAYVLDAADQKIVYLDSTDVGYLGADLASSSLPTGAGSTDLAVHSTLPLVYVSNTNDDTVTFFDANSVAYAAGSLGASSHPVADPREMAVDSAGDRLFVVAAGPGNGVYAFVTLDAVTGAYVNGTAAASTTWLMRGPPRLVYNPAADRLLMVPAGYMSPATYLVYDVDLAPLGFGPDVTTTPLGPNPVAIATAR